MVGIPALFLFTFLGGLTSRVSQFGYCPVARRPDPLRQSASPSAGSFNLSKASDLSTVARAASGFGWGGKPSWHDFG